MRVELVNSASRQGAAKRVRHGSGQRFGFRGTRRLMAYSTDRGVRIVERLPEPSHRGFDTAWAKNGMFLGELWKS
jgi:hypothetical protein